MLKRVTAEEVEKEAEKVAEALRAKWPGIKTLVSLQTPSGADAWLIVEAPDELATEIHWEAVEHTSRLLLDCGMDIVTIVQRV